MFLQMAKQSEMAFYYVANIIKNLVTNLDKGIWKGVGFLKWKCCRNPS